MSFIRRMQDPCCFNRVQAVAKPGTRFLSSRFDPFEGKSKALENNENDFLSILFSLTSGPFPQPSPTQITPNRRK
jgi:hypothetical protein